MAVVQQDLVQPAGTGTQQDPVQPAGKQEKKQWNVRGFINSPYVFILLHLVVGGFYLIQHPDLVQQCINNPWATGCILAVPVAAFLMKLVINFFSVIEQWIRLQFERARQSKKGYFFELVTAVFMFVSVSEAGPFFNAIQHDVLGGSLGYITVLAFDLIAVVCIDARRKELAKGGTKSSVYLAGVILSALVSMVANLYSALENFHAPSDVSIPALLVSAAPYVGVMFPIMIVFLAFSRDTEIEIDDAEAYRKQQQKRVDFLAVQREILEKVTREIERIDQIKDREFFLKSWLFTKKKVLFVIEATAAKVLVAVNDEIKSLKKAVEQKEQAMSVQAQTMIRHTRTVEDLTKQCQGYKETIAFQLEQLMQFEERMTASYRDFQTSIVSSLPQVEPLDYAKVAEQMVPLFPPMVQPNYKQIAIGIESKLQTQINAFIRTQQKEIAALKRAQKTEGKTEETTAFLDAQDGRKDAITDEVGMEVRTENMTIRLDAQDGSKEVAMNEADEELFEEEDDTEFLDTEEPTTDPEVEVVGKESGRDSRSSASIVNMVSRRKPLTVAEVAVVLQCTERQVRALRTQGRLAKDEQDERLIKAASVRVYLASRKVKA